MIRLHRDTLHQSPFISALTLLRCVHQKVSARAESYSQPHAPNDTVPQFLDPISFDYCCPELAAGDTAKGEAWLGVKKEPDPYLVGRGGSIDGWLWLWRRRGSVTFKDRRGVRVSGCSRNWSCAGAGAKDIAKDAKEGMCSRAGFGDDLATCGGVAFSLDTSRDKNDTAWGGSGEGRNLRCLQSGNRPQTTHNRRQTMHRMRSGRLLDVPRKNEIVGTAGGTMPPSPSRRTLENLKGLLSVVQPGLAQDGQETTSWRGNARRWSPGLTMCRRQRRRADCNLNTVASSKYDVNSSRVSIDKRLSSVVDPRRKQDNGVDPCAPPSGDEEHGPAQAQMRVGARCERAYEASSRGLSITLLLQNKAHSREDSPMSQVDRRLESTWILLGRADSDVAALRTRGAQTLGRGYETGDAKDRRAEKHASPLEYAAPRGAPMAKNTTLLFGARSSPPARPRDPGKKPSRGGASGEDMQGQAGKDWSRMRDPRADDLGGGPYFLLPLLLGNNAKEKPCSVDRPAIVAVMSERAISERRVPADTSRRDDPLA
ncbi:hypothetical protein C8R45DRAFT_938204 [Mycena sanguinolenta]|nr:hypothetical protein C8R45DRAFT_938204 [Mycena sanguinolenta]